MWQVKDRSQRIADENEVVTGCGQNEQVHNSPHTRSRESAIFHDVMEQRQVLPGNGLDGEFLLNTVSCLAAHVDGTIEILPLFDDHTRKPIGVVGGKQSPVFEIAHESSVSGYR